MTLTDDEIQNHPGTLLAYAACGDPLYGALVASHASEEGNLLQRTEVETVLAQVVTLHWAIDTYVPQGDVIRVAEVGFNKGLFTLLLRHIRPAALLRVYACDINAEAAKAAAIWNTAEYGVSVDFTPGDSCRVWPGVLARMAGPADVAWIDGGHEPKTLAADLGHTLASGAQLVLVDDVTWLPALGRVVSDAANYYGYRRVTPPTPPDRRGIAVLVRP